jgi:pimeloyl-ACP methyl ester carboxylesterase
LPNAPEELRTRVAAMQRRAFEVQAGAGETMQARDPIEDDPGALACVDAPALIAVGEHDKVDFLLAAQALAATLPNAELHVLPGAGHLAPIEQPEVFRELLLSFLS